MSARASGPPDDEPATQVRDPRRAPQPHPRIGVRAVEHATPTQIDDAPLYQGTPTAIDADPSRPVPVAIGADPSHPALRATERSEPIQVFSMKDQMTGPARPGVERRPLHVQLRSLAEVAGRHDTPVNLGRLAPPRDPRQARARRIRANVLWACVAIVLACGISLVVWFAAGR